ncbi:sulfite exporter TauE/SafE family protein [Desertivirga brevis]|uniref:sulfite exporter TauE/SafE family protein n=1 Tax=Desertivirga brevis TaxID=2810310 RepID=UPI001A974E2C|nr:sulfite exporter TauE/SafE family protein [Pedobacter sp. SYSU D00873]
MSANIQQNTVEIKGKSGYLWYVIPSVLVVGLLSIIIFNYHSSFSIAGIKEGLNSEFLIFLLIGVFAQLVDSTLGMGYGATSTSLLLSFGVPPAISSMGVHVAEMFTTGVSAISHYKFKNINKKLVLSLLIPGVAGSITGAYLLSDVIDGNVIKPFIAGYMIILATVIIIKGLKRNIQKRKTKKLGVLALFGGFMDSIGGGGWGPIVTSTLMGQGRDPRYTIGSVNTAEFAVAFASGITFMLFDGISGWQVIAGLIVGGIIAAPLGAYLVNKIPRKPITVLVGVLLILLSLKTLVKYF